MVKKLRAGRKEEKVQKRSNKTYQYVSLSFGRPAAITSLLGSFSHRMVPEFPLTS
jgi:hypothetical protein